MCTHKPPLWVFHLDPEITILGKIRRNFGCVTWAHPAPQLFDAPKKVTLHYIQHNLSVNRKTREVTLLQKLLVFTLLFVYTHSKGVFSHW